MAADGSLAKSAPRRVIGIDPGLRLTGYGVVEGDGRRPRLVEAGLIRVPETGGLGRRLDYLHRHVAELFAEHPGAVVAVEDLFSHYERPKTAILMGHARGVILLAAAQLGMEVFGYLPTRVKKTMTGSGQASKDQMQRAVQTEFSLPIPPEPADVADALAIAICHFHSLRAVG